MLTAASNPVGTANTPKIRTRSMLSIITDSRFGRLSGCKEKLEDLRLLILRGGGFHGMNRNRIHQSR